MRRGIVNLLMILSLSLSIATGLLWKRSYHTWDTLYFPHPAYGSAVRSAHGEVVVNVKLRDVQHRTLRRGCTSTEPNVISFGNFAIEVSDEPMDGFDFWSYRETKAFRWHIVDQAWTPKWMWNASFNHNDDGQQVLYDDPASGNPFVEVIPASPAGPQPVVGDRYLCARFPLWLLVAVFGTPVFIFARRGWPAWIRRRARKAGRCRNCGYDLRATSDRCPECGTSITSPSFSR